MVNTYNNYFSVMLYFSVQMKDTGVVMVANVDSSSNPFTIQLK